MKTKQTHILIFSPFYPPHIGGLQSHAEQFNQQLSKNGYSITTFTPRLPLSAPLHEPTSSHLTTIRFPAFEIIPNYPIPKFWQSLFWRQWQRLKQTQYDLVISRTRFFFTSLIALFFAKTRHLPHLHIEHGSDFISLANPVWRIIARLYDYTLGKLVLSQATTITANSQASADFVTKLSGRSSQVINRGVDKNAIATIKPADLSNNYRLPTINSTIITYVGRLIDGKGVADLLHALETLLTNYDIHCLIIGTGPQSAKLKQLAKQLDLTNHITFLGQQNFNQTIAILKSSDIFINPSHTEGLPTSVIEATLCKTAIIATNVGGTSEIVTHSHSAILVPPKQPDILAEKIQHLINNPDLRSTLATHAYQQNLNKFTWSTNIKQYDYLIKKLTVIKL